MRKDEPISDRLTVAVLFVLIFLTVLGFAISVVASFRALMWLL